MRQRSAEPAANRHRQDDGPKAKASASSVEDRASSSERGTANAMSSYFGRGSSTDGGRSKHDRVSLLAPPELGNAVIPSAVVDHYHRTFCAREDAQAYLVKRGITDTGLLRALKVGYADGSLLKAVPKTGTLRKQLLELGLITAQGRELLGGCLVVPIPDPLTGQWVNLYGRGLRTQRDCYLPAPLRGVLNYQAARGSEEVVLTGSILDALSFHQAGIATAIPIHGTNGFTADHLDCFKREGVKRVILALGSEEAGRKATDGLRGKLEAAGVVVRVAAFPEGIKGAKELLVSRSGDANRAFRRILESAEPRPASPPPSSPPPLGEKAQAPAPRPDGGLTLVRDGLTYSAHVHSAVLGRLRATVKVARGEALHVDSLDLYASRSRAEFARRASKALGVETDAVEAALLALVVQAERVAEEETEGETSPLPMTDAEREEALAFLRRDDLLDQVARDIDTLGYVGEETNKRLLYLVATSRKLEDPLSAIVLSHGLGRGAGSLGASGQRSGLEEWRIPRDLRGQWHVDRPSVQPGTSSSAQGAVELRMPRWHASPGHNGSSRAIAVASPNGPDRPRGRAAVGGGRRRGGRFGHAP